MLTLLFAPVLLAVAPTLVQERATPAPPEASEAVEFDQRLLAFAVRVEGSIAQGDPRFLSSSFDFEALMDTVDRGLDAPDAFRGPFTEGVASSFDLAQQIVDSNARSDGSYRFLRLLPGEPPRALFRLAGDDGLNYHELHLRIDEEAEPTGASAVRVVDVFVYVSGEALSTTFRRVYASGLVEANRSFLDRLLEGEGAYMKALPTIQEMNEAAYTDPERALELWASLDADVKFRTEVLTVRIQAASNVGDEAYLAALRDFREHHPDSPAMNLMLVDAHILRGETRKALRCVDALDEQVGGDPYLDLLRSNVLMSGGQLEEAFEHARRALERDPRLDYEAQWQFLTLGLAMDRHARTYRALLVLETEHGIEWQDLRAVEGYESFLASEAGKRWIERWTAANGDGR
jgi:tetratricopeptide (TPR) repeat protein